MIGLVLFLGGLALVLPTARVAAATTYTVNTASDDASTCAVGGTVCLRETLAQAGDGDKITFDTGYFGAKRTILLSRGALSIQHAVSILGPVGGFLTIGVSENVSGLAISVSNQTTASPATISGVTIAAVSPGQARATIPGSVSISLVSVEISGKLTVANTMIQNFSSYGIANSGTLLLTNSDIFGGPGDALPTSGTTTITNATLHSNKHGIVQTGGTVTMTNSIVSESLAVDVQRTGGTFIDGGYNLVGRRVRQQRHHRQDR
jgi:hypothetical protein